MDKAMEKGLILVVDDEKLIRWSLKEALEQEGYRVRDVETGKAAVQAVEENGRILKGPTAPRTTFKEIDPMGVVASDPGKVHKPLEGGIRFRQVQTAHDDEPRKEGRAYLYFWPGGQTERAAVQLQIGNAEEPIHTVTLIVAPLTGKVTIKDGAVDLPNPASDSEASDREDTGSL